MATIRLQDTRKQMMNGIDQPQAVYGGIAMWADPILSQLQVLESRTVASEVVKQYPIGPAREARRDRGEVARECARGVGAARGHDPPEIPAKPL